MKTKSIIFKKSPGKKTKKGIMLIVLAWAMGALLCRCGPFQNPDKIFTPDLSPPQFNSLTTPSEDLIIIHFNEPATIEASHISLRPELETGEILSSGNEVHIKVSTQVPGTGYTITATAMDEEENSLHFIAAFYGFNPSIPGLLINEFITRGSSTHPDLLEIKVTRDGNMGGITFYQGTRTNWDTRFIFPPFPVHKEDFILIHCKPRGLAEEVNETESTAESGGLDASPFAYDFWIPDGSGLSGNNGVLTLYSNPGGSLIDGVLYSNRTSESDENYLGFGSKKVKEQALELASQQGWRTSGPQINPEDGINPDNSTSTRSICRNKNGEDTDTKDDWHIVPTKGSSFGRENSDDVYKE